MSDNLQETIRESTNVPVKALRDVGSVEHHKLTEQIAADKDLASEATASPRKRRLRSNNLPPPAAERSFAFD